MFSAGKTNATGVIIDGVSLPVGQGTDLPDMEAVPVREPSDAGSGFILVEDRPLELGSAAPAGLTRFAGIANASIVTETIRERAIDPTKPILVVFDVHGTLFEPNWKEEMTSLYRKLTGLEPAADWIETQILNRDEAYINSVFQELSGMGRDEVAELVARNRRAFRDVTMPSVRAGAFELLRELHENNIPFVAVSSSRRERVICQLKGSGLLDIIPADRVIGRPFTERSRDQKDIIFDSVRSLFSGHTILSFDDWTDGMPRMRELGGINLGLPQGEGREYRTNREALISAGADYILPKLPTWNELRELFYLRDFRQPPVPKMPAESTPEVFVDRAWAFARWARLEIVRRLQRGETAAQIKIFITEFSDNVSRMIDSQQRGGSAGFSEETSYRFHNLKNDLNWFIADVNAFIMGKLDRAELLARVSPHGRSIVSMLLKIQKTLSDRADITVDAAYYGLLVPEASAEELRQVLVNLIKNATEHPKEENGWVNVHVAVVGGGRQIVITDNGFGMSEETVANLLRGVRIHNGKVAHSGEHGYGWVSVRALCDKMGIEIEIESKLGEGTTVQLNLPDNFLGE